MSRSYRHTPIIGNAKAESEKYDKQLANRKLRSHNKMILRTYNENDEEYEIMLKELREVSNEWAFQKDGKSWFDYAHPWYGICWEMYKKELMRK